MANTEVDVAYTAKLARLRLSEEEACIFQAQLDEVLQHAAKLSEVDVSGVEPSSHAVPLFDVFAEDVPRDWFTAEQALANAPHQANSLFIVPKVLE